MAQALVEPADDAHGVRTQDHAWEGNPLGDDALTPEFRHDPSGWVQRLVKIAPHTVLVDNNYSAKGRADGWRRVECRGHSSVKALPNFIISVKDVDSLPPSKCDTTVECCSRPEVVIVAEELDAILGNLAHDCLRVITGRAVVDNGDLHLFRAGVLFEYAS
jgi:hypothetical protein